MIASNGFLYMMGSNAFGKLGIGTTARSCVSPSLVDSLSNTTVKHVSCGFNHTVCCSQNGELFTWGDNSSG
jgi:alpha-tubulin suppressor-like RCC1 family protein